MELASGVERRDAAAEFGTAVASAGAVLRKRASIFLHVVSGQGMRNLLVGAMVIRCRSGQFLTDSDGVICHSAWESPLRKGDIITHVGPVALTSGLRAEELMTGTTADEHAVRVLRKTRLGRLCTSFQCVRIRFRRRRDPLLPTDGGV